jgi:hypothetical protein
MNWIGIGAVYPGIEPKVKREGGQRFVFVCRVRARPELRPRFTDTITVISVNAFTCLLHCANPQPSLKPAATNTNVNVSSWHFDSKQSLVFFMRKALPDALATAEQITQIVWLKRLERLERFEPLSSPNHRVGWNCSLMGPRQPPISAVPSCFQKHS